MGVGVLRFQHEAAFQQELRLVIGIEFHADLGEQAHAFGVVAMLLQEAAAQVFGHPQAVFLDQPDHHLQLIGQAFEKCALRPGELDRVRIAGRLLQLSQRAPAGQQA